eukprot:6620061-Prymnesium_polylepis.1
MLEITRPTPCPLEGWFGRPFGLALSRRPHTLAPEPRRYTVAAEAHCSCAEAGLRAVAAVAAAAAVAAVAAVVVPRRHTASLCHVPVALYAEPRLYMLHHLDRNQTATRQQPDNAPRQRRDNAQTSPRQPDSSRAARSPRKPCMCVRVRRQSASAPGSQQPASSTPASQQRPSRFYWNS